MKLPTLKPAISTLAPLIHAPHEVRHVRTDAGRHWYKTREWKRVRLRVFARDHYTCKRCHRMHIDTSLLVAHHVSAHKGNEKRFWDEGNLETVCKECHDGPIQREEKASYLSGCWD